MTHFKLVHNPFSSSIHCPTVLGSHTSFPRSCSNTLTWAWLVPQTFYLILTFLKSIDQLFRRMSLNLCSSDIFLCVDVPFEFLAGTLQKWHDVLGATGLCVNMEVSFDHLVRGCLPDFSIINVLFFCGSQIIWGKILWDDCHSYVPCQNFIHQFSPPLRIHIFTNHYNGS